MAFPLALALGLGSTLAGMVAGGRRPKYQPPNYNELLTDPAFALPDQAMLNPQNDAAYQMAVRQIMEGAGAQVQSQLPALASFLASRGVQNGSTFAAPVMARAYNEANRATIPSIAQLLAQSQQNNLTRFLAQQQAAQRARLLRSQLIGAGQLEQARGAAAQQADLTGGMFNLGGTLLGGYFGSKNPGGGTTDPYQRGGTSTYGPPIDAGASPGQEQYG